MQLLTFSLGGLSYGIPIDNVESIESRLDVVSIPAAPPHVRGIIRIHGVIIPVFNLASRFGVDGEVKVENLVVAIVEGMRIGLEVEHVNEIVEIEDSSVLPLPQIVSGSESCFNDVATRQGELIAMLNVSSLVNLNERESIQKMLEDHGD